jgi:hypothetical protein
MCQASTSSAEPTLITDVADKTPAAIPNKGGSRRRRLWELEGRMHCPIVGVCLPVPVLRKVVEKTFRGRNIDKDYDLHSGAVSECRSRTKLAEAVQRELEQRYVIAVRLASQHKTTEALQAWWAATSGHNLPGALWATVTHPRCSEALEHQVFGEVHMIQHQIGAVQRVDQARLEALVQENLTMARELAAIQTRSTQLQQEQTARIEAQQCLIMRLRADLLGRDTRLNILQEEVANLRAAIPGLKCRVKQAQELHLQAEHIHRLQRELLLERQECERRGRLLEAQEQGRHHFELQSTAAMSSVALAQQPSSDQPVLAHDLADRAVLCVGGRARRVCPCTGTLLNASAVASSTMMGASKKAWPSSMPLWWLPIW